MKRMPYEPPTEHYEEKIEAIDEEICHFNETMEGSFKY